ncbi:MAG: OmpP1/FadL family transporter [Sediminibacterium sp.]|jgi:hypothetical protein|nr:hypothetical protein [Chitinophagaceae bacterium]
MKKLFLLSISAIVTISALAQNPDEALRTAWFTQQGTARVMAIGGVMGSLGGDISANHINPAGIGLYKNKEFVLSPGFLFNNNKFNYRGTDSTAKNNGFGYGTSGFVIAGTNKGESKWTSSAFAVSVNQIANYNNRVQFRGFNNYSSFTEQYLEELTRDRADTNAALSNYIFGSSLAFRTFLVDTLAAPNGSVIGYQSLVPISTGTYQIYDARTSGGYHEIALGFAGNMADRLYVGGSFTIPIVKYNRELYYSEKDATTNPANEFSFFEYRETFTSNAIGIGAKLGAIYKPAEYIRLGFAFHTPQFMAYVDKIRSSIIANTENYAGLRKATSDELNSGNPGERKYNVTTPWRMIASASYVFRETKDIRRQRAFISADIEYVNYRAARFQATGDNVNNSTLRDYYSNLNSTVKDIYKGNINVKLGGELKFKTFMVRAGGAYYGSPYADAAIKASRTVLSGGLGYRNRGMFIDLTYSHVMNKDAVFAYRLADKANTFANQTGSAGTVMVTLGFKL